MSEDKKTFTEEIMVQGTELVKKVKELIKEGNVRKIIIKKESGETMFEIPLTAGMAVGGALTLMAPVIAAVGAGAALLTNVKVEIVRTKKDDSKDEE